MVSRVLSLIFVLSLGFSVSRAAEPNSSVLRARRTLDDLLKKWRFGTAQVALKAVFLPDGEIIYDRNADHRRIPASLVKLFTSAAALRTLGPEYRFRTEFSTDSSGNLYIRGTGDPALFPGDVHHICEILRALGVKGVRDVIVDDAYFDGRTQRGVWSPSDSSKLYLPHVNAATLNWGALEVWVRPGAHIGDEVNAELIPDLEFVDLVNRAKTSSRADDMEARLVFDDRAAIEVTGTCRAGSEARPLFVKIRDPALYTGAVFRAALEELGVASRGSVRRGEIPEDTMAVNFLYTHESRRLSDLVTDMNKFSSNFIAEHLLKALGAEVHGPPGTAEKGLEVIQDLIEEAGVPRRRYSLLDGSGLSRENHLSASQFVRVLTFMFQSPSVGPEYLASLALPGGEGTLEERFEGEEFRGRLRAKTGSMRGIASLAGYIGSEGGADIAFCLIVNRYPGTSERMERLQEDVVRALLPVHP
jgi:D-alanyl-D-alanine carboxypeptidase/D-alanyl-D-alanine-endopeptidase (penicillin-binding protein 4)